MHPLRTAGLALTLALALALTGGCEEKQAEPATTGEAAAAATPAATTPEEAAAIPEGWALHADKALGFEVLVPPGAPRVMNEHDRDVGLRADAKNFLFPDNLGMAQVIVLEYTADGAYDLEAGLDGGCKQAVAKIGGKMANYDKVADGARPARQFQFAAKPGGKSILGVGRAVGTGPKTIKVAMAMWDAGKPAGADLAKAFIKSFVAK